MLESSVDKVISCLTIDIVPEDGHAERLQDVNSDKLAWTLNTRPIPGGPCATCPSLGRKAIPACVDSCSSTRSVCFMSAGPNSY